MNAERILKRTLSSESFFEKMSDFSINEDQDDLNNTFCYGSSFEVFEFISIWFKFNSFYN